MFVTKNRYSKLFADQQEIQAQYIKLKIELRSLYFQNKELRERNAALTNAINGIAAAKVVPIANFCAKKASVKKKK